MKKYRNTSEPVPTCVGVNTGRDMEVTQGIGMVSDVAVSVCVLRAKLRGQQLTVCHQS